MYKVDFCSKLHEDRSRKLKDLQEERGTHAESGTKETDFRTCMLVEINQYKVWEQLCGCTYIRLSAEIPSSTLAFKEQRLEPITLSSEVPRTLASTLRYLMMIASLWRTYQWVWFEIRQNFFPFSARVQRLHSCTRLYRNPPTNVFYFTFSDSQTPSLESIKEESVSMVVMFHLLIWSIVATRDVEPSSCSTLSPRPDG